MRLIHTADWHLGNSMHQIDRTEEQRSFLKWLKTKVDELEADTLIVSGDVFDVHTPSNSSQTMYYEFVSDLVNTKCKNMVIIGGNHDSGAFLDAPKSVLDMFNVHIVGTYANKDVDDLVFELKDKESGEAYAVCAAVPFVNEVTLRRLLDDEEIEDGKITDKVYTKLYRQCLEKAKELRGDRDIPLIATGHLYAAALEGRYEDAEREYKTDDGVQVLDVVGKLGKVHVGCFPEEFDYVALGHIHYSTCVAKEKRIRYSGSPFVMGFDDAEIKHYIHQVDINMEEASKVTVTRIEVPESMKYKRLKGSAEEIIEKLEKIVEEAKNDKECTPVNLELMYRYEATAALDAAVEKMSIPKHVRIVSWKLIEELKSSGSHFGEYDIKNVKSIKPEEIFERLIRKSPLKEDETKGKTDEEIEAVKKEKVDKYLPYFMSALNAVQIGEKNEDPKA